MTTTRALAMVLIASLPLCALTARTFLVHPGGSVAKADLPRYEPDSALLDKVRKEAERPVDKVVAVDGDPTGWRSGKEAANLPAPYDVAATLGRAGDAVRDADAGRVAAAIAELDKHLNDSKRTEIQSLQPAGPRLVVALQDARKRLETHRLWLDDRTKVVEQLRKAESALADPPAGVGAEAALAMLEQLKQQHPAVVPDDGTDEPAGARTASEDSTLAAIQKRASFRHEFQKAKRSENAAQRQALLGRFITNFGSEPLDDRDKPLLDDAKKLFDDAKLEVLWAQAQAVESADDLVRALRRWLDAAGDAGSGAKARKLVDAWLMKRIAEGPDASRFKDLQEGIVDGEKGARRLLGVFDKADPEGKRWRWWTDKEQKADPAYPRGDGRRPPVSLKGKPLAPPLVVVLVNTYRDKRKDYLAKPLGAGNGAANGEGFAAACEEIARNAEVHGAIASVPEHQHPAQQDYEAIFEPLQATLEAAARAARELDAAARGAGLEAIMKP